MKLPIIIRRIASDSLKLDWKAGYFGNQKWVTTCDAVFNQVEMAKRNNAYHTISRSYLGNSTEIFGRKGLRELSRHTNDSLGKKISSIKELDLTKVFRFYIQTTTLFHICFRVSIPIKDRLLNNLWFLRESKKLYHELQSFRKRFVY